MHPKLYIISGERSGDLHTSNFLKLLYQINDKVIVRAWAGDLSKAQGADVIVDYKELAVMGFIEVIKNLNKIRKRLSFCKKDILGFNPDLVLLVDYGGFNMKIAKFCHQHHIPVYYYISPKVWAWNTKRAFKIKKYVDKMFVILPFEKQFFKKFDYDVTYVGNPLLDEIRRFKPNIDFRIDNDLGGKPIIAILPGSRKQEVLNMLSIMVEVSNAFPQYRFVVAGVNNLDRTLYKQAIVHSDIKTVFEQTYDLLHVSTAAIVTSGTATLETALFKVPQVIGYITGAMTYRIMKFFVKVEYIGLANLIMGKEVVPELLQDNFNVDDVSKALKALLPGEVKRTKMLSDYDALYEKLENKNPSEALATYVNDFLTSFK